MCTLVFAEKQEIPQEDLLKSNQNEVDNQAKAQNMIDYLEKSKLEKGIKAKKDNVAAQRKLDQENKSNNPKTVINEEQILDYRNDLLIDEKRTEVLNKKASLEKIKLLKDSSDDSFDDVRKRIIQKAESQKRALFHKNKKALEAKKAIHKENHRTVPFSDFPMGQLITVDPGNGSRDGVISATVTSTGLLS